MIGCALPLLLPKMNICARPSGRIVGPPSSRLPERLEVVAGFPFIPIVIREGRRNSGGRGLSDARAARGVYCVGPEAAKVRVKDSLGRFRDQPAATLWEMERMIEVRGVLEVAAGLTGVRTTEVIESGGALDTTFTTTCGNICSAGSPF